MTPPAQAVVEDNGKLLFYTETYEGGKCLPTYFSFGAVPAQQIRPFIPSAPGGVRSPRVLLFGADYVWPCRSFEIAKPIIEENGGESRRRDLPATGGRGLHRVASAVRDTQPDYMFSLYPAAFAPALQALDDAGLLEGLGIRATIFVGDPDLPGVDRSRPGECTPHSRYFTPP